MKIASLKISFLPKIAGKYSLQPVMLLLVCLLAFGLQIPWLGYYWDDWPGAWFLHRLGPAGFTQVFSVDRPALGWLFMLTTALIGKSTLGWQLLGVLARWLSCLALWRLLRAVWPERITQATWVTLLFAVYPGFKQQHIAMTYSHDWLIMAGFFLSLTLQIWAVRKLLRGSGWSRNRSSWFLFIISWLLSAYAMFADEYYFGLELLRPILLWLVFSEQGDSLRQRLKRTLLNELPYAISVALFLFWRLWIHISPRGQVQVFERLVQNPLGGFVTLLTTVLTDTFRSSFSAWSEIFNFPKMLSLGIIPSVLYGITTIIGVVLCLLYLKYTTRSDTALAARSWSLSAIIIGLLALFAGGIPFWVTYQPIGLSFPWDRFTLPMIFGTSLLLTGLLQLLIPKTGLRILFLSIMLGLATGLHVTNGNLYRREWAAQKTMFWQITWRAPGIQPGTVLLTTELPFTYFSDNSLTAPLNWIYEPQTKNPQNIQRTSSIDRLSLRMDYLFYVVESRLGFRLPSLEKDLPIEQPYRTLTFYGSTSQALVVYVNPPACLRIIDPVVDARLPQKPNYLAEMLPLSNLNTILPDADPPAQPPAAIFGSEPEPDWCYYFEKADLARQLGDWSQVVNLGEQAFNLNQRLYEVNAPELTPYIEGYAHLGQWQEAQQLTQQAYQLSTRMQRMLCATWGRIAQSTSPDGAQQASLAEIRTSLKCTELSGQDRMTTSLLSGQVP